MAAWSVDLALPPWNFILPPWNFILRLVCKSESRGKVELGQCPATSAPTDLQTNLKRSRLWPRHEVLHATSLSPSPPSSDSLCNHYTYSYSLLPLPRSRRVLSAAPRFGTRKATTSAACARSRPLHLCLCLPRSLIACGDRLRSTKMRICKLRFRWLQAGARA